MNPVLLRKQLQENASDLQDFCKDLKNWGDEMKQKEKSVEKRATEKTVNGKNKTRKIEKSEKKKSTKVKTVKKPTTKIGVTDYSAWEKFDVDAECQKVEEDIEEDSELTDECNDNMQDEAIIEKEKGNKFVKTQKWDEAITCYSKAINFYAYDPIFYANRALCYLKKNCYQEAESDCNLSLKLDSTYVKAYQRRAAAREGLNKLEHAEIDLIKVLEVEPKNKESWAALEKLRKRRGIIEKPPDQRPVSKFTISRNTSNASYMPGKTQISPATNKGIEFTDTKKNFDTSNPVPTWSEEDIILVKPVKKLPHLRSQKPLKRIKIIEKDNSTATEKISEVDDKPKEPEAIKEHVIEKIQTGEVEEPPKVVSVFKKRQQINLEKTQHDTALPRSNQKTDCLKSDDLKIIERFTPVHLDPEQNQQSISKEIKNTSNLNRTNCESKNIDNNKRVNEYIAPKNAVQFFSTWKNLKTTTDKYKYLKLINPQDLPKIFLDFLESNVFGNILEVLASHFIPNKDRVYNILEHLSQVKRFGTFTMFMTPSDKNNLWMLFDYIRENEQDNKNDVDKLIQKYEL